MFRFDVSLALKPTYKGKERSSRPLFCLRSPKRDAYRLAVRLRTGALSWLPEGLTGALAV
jgi:hypothetical protein